MKLQMTEKSRIVEALGERGLLLPALVNEALAANDRAKYRFTLLQGAKAHADYPDAPHSSLRREREVAGLNDPGLDAVVAGSAKLGADAYRIPKAKQICDGLYEDVRAMIAPLDAGREAAAPQYTARLETLRAQLRLPDEDLLEGARIDAMTSAGRREHDSVHLLVMDLHKALNKIQTRIAETSIAGAKAYALREEDRPLVEAFMRGLNRTAALKFDHPGLATTATRSGSRLVLQNDIGTTDAHVLVVHVAADSISVTYTDVHLQRLLFFESMLDAFETRWEDALSRTDRAMQDGVYHLAVGRFESAEPARRKAYLEFLGSRIVFLIDWNRARKRLRGFVGKSAAVELLKWAAANDVGHMAFLKAGGEQLIYDALEFASKGPFRFGETLADMLGEKAAVQYLQFVLKTCAAGLLNGRDEALIRDEVRAELFDHIRSARHGLLDIAAEHAALILEIAAGLRNALLRLNSADAADHLRRNAQRAKDWEGRADELVNRARAADRRADAGRFVRRLLEAADDIADELEEAAYHLTIAPAALPPALLEPLRELAGLALQGGQEYVKVLEAARSVRRGAAREDMQDFLEAVHRVMAIEHEADRVGRGVEAALVAGASDFRQLYVLSESATNLEQATDGLMHAALMVRDHFLGEVMTG